MPHNTGPRQEISCVVPVDGVARNMADMPVELDGRGERRVVWQDVELRLPRSWDMVRFGLHYGRGVCTFADPFAERLQVSWQRDTPPPDFERLLSDLHAAERTGGARGDADADVRTETLAMGDGWHGLVVERGGGVTTRAARYDASCRALMEAVLFWERERRADIEANLLHHLQFSPAAERRTWQAFGISADVPAGLALADCRCLPADVTLAFRERRSPRSASIRRMGFVTVWLKDPLQDWLRMTVPGPCRVLSALTRATGAGHELAILETRRRGRLSRPLVGRKPSRFDYAAVCSAEQRLYHVVEVRPPSQPPLIRLSCACGPILDR